MSAGRPEGEVKGTNTPIGRLTCQFMSSLAGLDQDPDVRIEAVAFSLVYLGLGLLLELIVGGRRSDSEKDLEILVLRHQVHPRAAAARSAGRCCVGPAASPLGQAGGMSSLRSRPSAAGSEFAGFRFPPDVIAVAVRWYLRVRHEALFDREEMKGLLLWAVAAVH